jgi:serine hydrolase
MNGALVLPGLHNSDPDHWQSRWEARDPTLRRVVQDDWQTPRCSDWKARLDEAIELAGSNTVLVAHSLSCALVAHWAATGSPHSVRGALLVAPADAEASTVPRGPRGFAPIPMQRLQFRSIVVASVNDPYVSLERAYTLATAWGSAFLNIGEAGHINSASGLGDWPEGLAFCDGFRASQTCDPGESSHRLRLRLLKST